MDAVQVASACDGVRLLMANLMIMSVLVSDHENKNDSDGAEGSRQTARAILRVVREHLDKLDEHFK